MRMWCFGIFARDDLDVSEMTYFGLYSLQLRGSGKHRYSHCRRNISQSIIRIKELVSEVFEENRLEELKGGNIALGHVSLSRWR